MRKRGLLIGLLIASSSCWLSAVAQEPDWAVLTDPLMEGSQVVVNAARSLSEGLHVQPVGIEPGRSGLDKRRARR